MLELTVTEQKYLNIVTAHLGKPDESLDDLALRLDVPSRTVDRAIAWGKRTGALREPAASSLRRFIAEHRKHLKFLENELQMRKRIARKAKKPVGTQGLKHLSSEIREVRMVLMQLEGIYESKVKIDLNANVEGEVDLGVVVYVPSNGRETNAADD